MLSTYRIFKTKHAANWFDGEGAFRYGGRWNTRGTRILYTAESVSLAALEMLVHLDSEAILPAYSYATAEFDDSFILPISELRQLPKNWNASPPPIEIQKIGDAWARSKASAVLKVPTSVLPVEHNYLINLEHPDFSKIELGAPQKFSFDERLR